MASWSTCSSTEPSWELRSERAAGLARSGGPVRHTHARQATPRHISRAGLRVPGDARRHGDGDGAGPDRRADGRGSGRRGLVRLACHRLSAHLLGDRARIRPPYRPVRPPPTPAGRARVVPRGLARLRSRRHCASRRHRARAHRRTRRAGAGRWSPAHPGHGPRAGPVSARAHDAPDTAADRDGGHARARPRRGTDCRRATHRPRGLALGVLAQPPPRPGRRHGRPARSAPTAPAQDAGRQARRGRNPAARRPSLPTSSPGSASGGAGAGELRRAGPNRRSPEPCWRVWLCWLSWRCSYLSNGTRRYPPCRSASSGTAPMESCCGPGPRGEGSPTSRGTRYPARRGARRPTDRRSPDSPAVPPGWPGRRSSPGSTHRPPRRHPPQPRTRSAPP